MSRVFLSYCHRDRDFVRKLYDRLTADGIDCFIDLESIEWGEVIPVKLEQALEECRQMLLVMSPAYFTSQWTEMERTAAVFRDPANRDRTLLPLMVAPCFDMLPKALARIKFIDVSTPERFEKAYPEILRALGAPAEAPPAAEDPVSGIPPPGPLPERYFMPHRSLSGGFVGRVKALFAVRDAFETPDPRFTEGICVITGMAGVGKSQLAVEYAHRFGGRFPGGVFWIDVDRGIRHLLGCLSDTCGLVFDESRAVEEQVEDLWERLSRLSPSLIILDNFPEKTPLEPWIPPGLPIHVLMTARRRDMYRFQQVFLDVLDPDEGVALLSSGERSFGPEAEDLVELLGALPLALELAAHFLNFRKTLSVESLIREIENIGEMKALDVFAGKYTGDLPTGHAKKIAATFQICVQQATPDARELLAILSHFAPKPVPRGFLRKIFDIDSGDMLEDPLDDAVAELVNDLSLINLDAGDDPWMHRLLSGFVRSTMEIDPQIPETVAEVVAAEMGRIDDEKDAMMPAALKKIVPHGVYLLETGGFPPETALEAAFHISKYYWVAGRFRAAESYARLALDLAESLYEPGDECILAVRSDLGMILMDLDSLEEARALLEEVLAADEKRRLPGHPDISLSKSNLAMVYKKMGDYAAAGRLLEAALSENIAHFGPNHPAVAVRKSNLALVRLDTGDLESARELLESALDIDRAHYVPDHPTIAVDLSNLATVLGRLGEREAAERALRKALAADLKYYGDENHPAVVADRTGLAAALLDSGRFAEAREEMEKAFTADLQNYEPGHPHIAEGRAGLAVMTAAAGDLDAAVSLMEEAVRESEHSLGYDHPVTRRRREKLAEFTGKSPS